MRYVQCERGIRLEGARAAGSLGRRSSDLQVGSRMGRARAAHACGTTVSWQPFRTRRDPVACRTGPWGRPHGRQPPPARNVPGSRQETAWLSSGDWMRRSGVVHEPPDPGRPQVVPAPVAIHGNPQLAGDRNHLPQGPFSPGPHDRLALRPRPAGCQSPPPPSQGYSSFQPGVGMW